MNRPEPLTAAEVAELDPGIAETVLWLRANDFDTTDSGDGSTKFKVPKDEIDACALPVPNVAIAVEPDDLVAECQRLQALLASIGVEAQAAAAAFDPANVEIQGSYDPATGTALILLLGFTLPARAVA